MQNKKKANWGSLARLLRFLWQDYKLSLSIAFVLIVVASLATVNLTASIQSLVDVYVQPMLKSGSHDFGPLLRFLTSVAVFCLIGVIANYVASLLMATISQDSLRSLRNQLFARMQKLPVRYLDTHQHGDIISIYTNDIDALRQAVEQSIPQLLQTTITLIGVTVTMLTVSPLLFIVVLVMVGIMFMVIKNVSAESGRYFGEQQKNLGIENGFIEEMMSGQKVVKAFVHEEESMADFQFNSGRDVSFFGKRILKADYAEVYMEYAEVCFLLSEVNGWDSQWYKKGVIASMEKWEVDPTVATNFANGLPTANKENVITQKYIALYMNPNEAWAEYRRTGYPQTLIKVGETVPLNKPTTSGETTYTFTSTVAELTDLPERLYYPTTYKLINFENYKEALKNMNMSEDSMAKKLIFAGH